MTSLVQTLGDRVVGTVEEVTADRITVLLDPEAPRATALNTGAPAGFPRINGYVLIPNESGATACVISSVRIERLPFPKRKGMQKDFGLVDLPFPARVMSLTPLGTLKDRSTAGDLSFEVRRGVDVFPSVGDPVVLPTPGQLRAIVEGEDQETAGRILLGHCPTAGRAPVHVDPDKLFGRHLAVLGNTGAGKSCSVAGLIRWSLEAATAARIQAASAEPEGSTRRAHEGVPERQAPCGQPSPHRRKNCVSRNQAQTLAHERVTRQPPTLDCGSTASRSVHFTVPHPISPRELVRSKYSCGFPMVET